LDGFSFSRWPPENLEFIIHAENEYIILFYFGIKHGYQTRPGVDPVKELDPGLHGLTQVNPVQPKII
jgi:hypothetical protein